MLRIGFIGIGTMGAGMAQNLLKRGFEVFAYNRTRDKVERITHKNLHIADSPKSVGEKSDIVITCVSNDEALRDVVFSENGFFSSLKENKIFIDCGTSSVELTAKITEECKKRKVRFLDAPITGSKTGAENGTLLFMVGGSRKTLEECTNVFNAMGKHVVYCGDNTLGQKAKIALNLAQSLILESYLEGAFLALKSGVPIESILEIFDNSGAKNGVSSVKIPKVLARDFSPHFKLELMNKDIGLAMREIKKLNLDLPLSTELAKVFKKAMKKGLKEEDFACIVKLLEENSGIRLKGK